MSLTRKIGSVLCILWVCMPFCSFAQITVAVRQQSVRAAIREIERASEYRFFFNSSLPDLDKQVDLEVKDATIGATLDKLLARTAIDYSVNNYQVTLVARKSPAAEPLTGTVTDAAGENLVGVTVIVPSITTDCVMSSPPSNTLSSRLPRVVV